MKSYTKLIEHLKQNQYTWLITGVAGFIGSNLLETLLTLNQKVVGLDNFETGYQHNAIKNFMNSSKKNKLVYTKKDPLKHLHKITREYDDENLDDVKPYSHIEDSGQYIHNLRREKKK